MSESILYNSMCFVIMPFSEKEVYFKGDKKELFNFDMIYQNLFKAAIEMVDLPEGGKLTPKRSDSSNTTGIITDEMFRDILMSRVVLADISGTNPNVFYELAARHALRQTGTVVIQMKDTEIPFDIKDLQCIPYEFNINTLRKYQEAIRDALSQKIQLLTRDSPIALALQGRVEWPDHDPAEEDYQIRSWFEVRRDAATVDQYVQDAEKALSNEEYAAAVSSLRAAYLTAPHDLRVGMLLADALKSVEKWDEAESVLENVTRHYAKYAVAWRELGVVLSKQTRIGDAIDKFDKAVELNPYDVDAWCARGGALKDQNRIGDAIQSYEQGLQHDPGSPYALLNLLALKAGEQQRLPDPTNHHAALDAVSKTCLRQIEKHRNLPWSHFDLAQVYFFRIRWETCSKTRSVKV